LSDDGVSAVAERCAALEYLNLSGLHRVTDAAALRVTHNLWRLRTLCLEDLHLITDAIFFFDAKKDGRAAARQQMSATASFVRSRHRRDPSTPSPLILNTQARRAARDPPRGVR